MYSLLDHSRPPDLMYTKYFQNSFICKILSTENRITDYHVDLGHFDRQAHLSQRRPRSTDSDLGVFFGAAM